MIKLANGEVAPANSQKYGQKDCLNIMHEMIKFVDRYIKAVENIKQLCANTSTIMFNTCKTTTTSKKLSPSTVSKTLNVHNNQSFI
jgi:ribosomal protein S19